MLFVAFAQHRHNMTRRSELSLHEWNGELTRKVQLRARTGKFFRASPGGSNCIGILRVPTGCIRCVSVPRTCSQRCRARACARTGYGGTGTSSARRE